MLSWVEHPSAIQLLLSISNRFRTAGIRKQAEESVAALAERKNWTIDELSDRTIPSAGFDDSQMQTLDFGPRQFTAKLDAELDITLLNEEGKPIKSLPEPRQTDDEAKAKAAKKQLSAAKKEVDVVVKHQKPRLYEAMCTRRSWSFADFDQFLHRHPIVRHLCTRLVWATVQRQTGMSAPPTEAGMSAPPKQMKQTFRPLGDGTFTDANDEPVTLGDDDAICLAHGSLVSADVAKKWNQHLADYEIAPLFEQFREGGGFELTDELKRETSIEQFHGYLIEAFKLRGRLTKLGYTRGSTEDGGWFSTYIKRIPSLKLTATIEFSGNPLPEQNRTVALHNLHFTRTAADGESTYASGSLPLGEISSVLLSECFNDLRSVAAEGSGYDGDWEKKVAM